MTASDAPRRNPLSPWLAPATVLIAALIWNLAAWGIDLSPLEQPDTSWGFAFATTFYTVMIGLPLLLVTGISAGVAQARPMRAREALTSGAVACAVVAVMLVALTGLMALTEGLALTSAVLFSVASLVVAAGLIVPLVRLRNSLEGFPER